MNFVFEDKQESLNFTSNTEILRSGVRLFSPSPIVEVASRQFSNFRFGVDSLLYPKRYIVSTGVNHHPTDWAKPNIFQYLNPRYLKDIQNGKAMLLIDQSLEGHQTPWLWNWFHEECARYNINPKAVVYVTGNQIASEQYTAWAQGKQDKISVISYAHFEKDVRDMAKQHNITESVDSDIAYKEQHDIKTFNCLQKRLRPHRLWFYTQMYKDGLLGEGLISQNPFTVNQTYLDGQRLAEDLVIEANTTLPSILYGKNNNEHPDNYYIRRILKDVCNDSWVSVVSEVAYSNSDQSVFISEKTFKAIACCHPFILLSSSGTLKELRDMGYKTFDGFIDETYDTLPPVERFVAITSELKRIASIKDKLSWYAGMKDILVHNYNTLQYNASHKDRAIIKLEQCYKEYFNDTI